MYVTVRKGRVADTEIFDDRDYAIDLGEDGSVIGYDIQHASQHPEVIAEALRLLRGDAQAAA